MATPRDESFRKQQTDKLRGQQARIGNFVRHMIHVQLLAAVTNLGLSNPSLIQSRLINQLTMPMQRNRQTMCLLREFLVLYRDMLDVLVNDLTSLELDAYGFLLESPKYFSDEVRAFFDLLLATQQERVDLMIQQKEQGTFPRFLFPDRSADELFLTGWINNQELARNLQKMKEKKLSTDLLNEELPQDD
jgi:hypothetical protein